MANPTKEEPNKNTTPREDKARGVERSADAGKSEAVVKKEEADDTVDNTRRPSL